MSECLTLKAQYASMRERFACHHTGIVDKELYREIVCTVNNEIVILDDVESIVRHQELTNGIHLDIGIDGKHLVACRLHLGMTHITGEMNHLALKIGEIYHITIHNTYCSYSSCGEIEGYGSTKSTRAHNKNLSITNFLLTFHTHVLEQYVAAVSQELFLSEIIHKLVLHP